MQGPEIISSAARILSSASPSQLIIRIQPEVASQLGLREGQTIRSAVAEDGKSIQLFRENISRTFVLNLGAFKGQNLPLRLVASPQGLTLRIDSAESQAPDMQSSPKTYQPTQSSESSRWVRLFNQNPSLQQSPLLHSGLSLVKEFEKRGLRLDKETAKFFASKAAEISAGSIKSALYFSGVVGKAFDRRSTLRIGNKDLSTLLQGLKETAATGIGDGSTLDELDSALDYLDNNKLKSLVSQRCGQQCFQFFLPLEGLPSVEVTITQLGSDNYAAVDEPTHLQGLSQPTPAVTYEDLRSHIADKTASTSEQGVFIDTEFEADQNSARSDKNSEGRSQREADEESDRSNTKGGWSVDLDWHFGEDDRVSINAVTNAQNKVNLMFWITNEETLALAKAFQSRLLSQISSLNFETASCEFIEGERPLNNPGGTLGKTSFTLEA